VPTVYTTTAPGTSAAYFRIATIPMTTAFKDGIFTIKAYTATGTSTEATVIINLSYYASNYGSQQVSFVTNASHSYNSATTAENGWVLYYVRVSFDATNGYIDVYKYKTTDITIQCKSLTQNDWVWSTGVLSANPTIGAYRNTQVTLNAGFSGYNISANYANSSSYTNYGILGGQTLTNTTNKTNNWLYFGYITFDYNASYLRGRSINSRIILQELIHDGSVSAANLDDFSLDIRANLGYHADGNAFNTTVPDIAMTINGRTTLTTNDIAAFVYSSTTTAKVIRFYIKAKGPNTLYTVNPINRYGRAFATSSFSQTTGYLAFTYVSDQTQVASLPTPVQGSITYVSDIRYGLTKEDQTKLNNIAENATANAGTVTSISGTGTVSGITLSGTVTSSGNLTLGGTLSVAAENIAITDTGSFYTGTNVETVLQEIGPLVGNGLTASDEIPATPLPRDADTLGGVAAANYALKAGPTFTGTVILPSTTSIGNVSNTEISYLDGVTSAIQTQFGSKAPLADPTFTGTLVAPTINASTALQIGGVAITATAAELNYVDGVTSSIQTQFGNKAATESPTLTGTPLAPTATAGTNTTQIATTAFVNSSISANLGVVNAMGFSLSDETTALTTGTAKLTYRVPYACKFSQIPRIYLTNTDGE
jgi:hypothetical protein